MLPCRLLYDEGFPRLYGIRAVKSRQLEKKKSGFRNQRGGTTKQDISSKPTRAKGLIVAHRRKGQILLGVGGGGGGTEQNGPENDAR